MVSGSSVSQKFDFRIYRLELYAVSESELALMRNNRIHGGTLTLVESAPSSQFGNSAGDIFSIDSQLAKQVASRLATKRTNKQPDLSWRTDASCRDSNPELFFPIGSTGGAEDQIAKARQVCLSCSAREACLKYALETNQDSGVWGASTAEYRRDLRRNFLRTPTGEP